MHAATRCATGRRTTERGFESRRENANAVHALAHAMFEDGSTADAEALIESWLPIYDRTGLLHGHISWHQALLALEQGDAARALAIYADRMQPKVSTAPPIAVVSDGASLLWRCLVYRPRPWHESRLAHRMLKIEPYRWGSASRAWRYGRLTTPELFCGSMPTASAHTSRGEPSHAHETECSGGQPALFAGFLDTTSNIVRKSSKCSSTNRKRVVSPAKVTSISDVFAAWTALAINQYISKQTFLDMTLRI